MRTILTLIIVLLLTLTIIPTTAQDDPPYQLHQPTAEEYLTLLPEIMEQIPLESGDDYHADVYTMSELINTEVNGRYNDSDLHTIPYISLIAASPNLPRYYQTDSIFYELRWHRLVFEAWLQQINPDLSTQNTWVFGDYTLNVQPVDFTGNGVNEYSAELIYEPDSPMDFKELFVLEQVSNSYIRFGDTQIWFGTVFNCFKMRCDGQGEILPTQDVTDDGIPDWIVSWAYCPQPCYEEMQIYSYQNGEFINVFPDAHPKILSGNIYTRDYGSWDFENVDDDTALELRQSEYFTDFRGCEFTAERIFDWNNETLMFDAGDEHEVDYADSDMCALRQSHNAMKELDFAAAITHIEHMLSFPVQEGLEDLWQYATVRLAVAYALEDNLGQAEQLLNDLNPTDVQDEAVKELIIIAKESFANDRDGLQLCSAIHNNWQGRTLLLRQYGQNVIPYLEVDGFIGDFSPANSGCNFAAIFPENNEQTITPTYVPRPTATPNPDPLACSHSFFYGFCGDLNNPEETLPMIDVVLAQPFHEGKTVNFVYAFRYLRAYMLEKSGESDAALSEYVALYEDVPDSAWGKLAGLHIELR